jgi:hypothetical protein
MTESRVQCTFRKMMKMGLEKVEEVVVKTRI